MTKHNYAICLSDIIHHEMEAEHLDDKQSHRHPGIFLSGQAFPATTEKRIQARFSPPTYLLYL